MRRILTTTLCLTILVCLTSKTAWSEGFLCSNLGILCPKTVDVDRTVQRGGLRYEVNSQTPFTGYTVTKFNNGQIREKTQYKDGKKDGRWVEYSRNGQIEEKRTFKNGKKDGPWVKYGIDGQLAYERTYKNGKKHGPWVEYHLFNGKLWFKGTYKDGKEDGPWFFYDDNGRLDYKLTYKDGKKISD